MEAHSLYEDTEAIICAVLAMRKRMPSAAGGSRRRTKSSSSAASSARPAPLARQLREMAADADADALPIQLAAARFLVTPVARSLGSRRPRVPATPGAVLFTLDSARGCKPPVHFQVPHWAQATRGAALRALPGRGHHPLRCNSPG